MSKLSSSPPAIAFDSSSGSLQHERPKYLSRSHGKSLPAGVIRNSAQTLDSDAPDSCHRIATTLLRKSRNELDLTQELAAALVETHPISLGRRERGQVDLGPLRDWVLMLRQIVRSKGPEAAAAFMASFVEALAERDAKK